MKKLTALLACIALLLGLLAGCGSGAEVEYYDGDTENAANDAAEEGVGIMLGGTGYETYDPDLIVGAVNGVEVTWMEYFYWLNYYANYYVQMANMYGISLTSWDAVGELASERSTADALFSLTEYSIAQYNAILTNTQDAGITLSDEDRAALDAEVESTCDTDGDGVVSEEELADFDAYLAENYIDRDFYMFLLEVALLSNKAFDEFYGENGEEFPDELTMDYVEGVGAMYAKHILLLTVDSATGESLDEDTIAQKLETAATLQAELAAVQDDKDALIAMFDEYMADYTEDSGYSSYPDGYVFVDGDMVEEFENAVKALDDNYGLSDVVESSYGYHIILRLPITPDTICGTNSSTGQDIPFRYAAAEEQYSSLISAWTDSAEIEWYDGFDVPDMLAIFG